MFSSIWQKLCSHICTSVFIHVLAHPPFECLCWFLCFAVLPFVFIDMFVRIYHALSCAHCSFTPVCFYCVDFQCLLVVTVAQYPSVKLASYCDDCSINLSAHRGAFESSSLFIVSLVGHWTLHHCVPICLERRSVCRQLFKGSIALSLVARSCSPEQLLKKALKV